MGCPIEHRILRSPISHELCRNDARLIPLVFIADAVPQGLDFIDHFITGRDGVIRKPPNVAVLVHHYQDMSYFHGISVADATAEHLYTYGAGRSTGNGYVRVGSGVPPMTADSLNYGELLSADRSDWVVDAHIAIPNWPRTKDDLCDRVRAVRELD